MPVATTTQAVKNEREQRLRAALKEYILKERQKKEEDHAAELEMERLRKEQEAKDRENEMTLGETREQMVKVEKRLDELRNQKDQLCLQLKKMLNKQQKENELSAMQMQSQTMQMYLPPRTTQQPQQVPFQQPQLHQQQPSTSQPTLIQHQQQNHQPLPQAPPPLQPHHQQPQQPTLLHKPANSAASSTSISGVRRHYPEEMSDKPIYLQMTPNPPIKRGRSQSPPHLPQPQLPPPQQQHQNLQSLYKASPFSIPQQKHEDVRRSAVLWNKPQPQPSQHHHPQQQQQYPLPGTLFYQTSALSHHPQHSSATLLDGRSVSGSANSDSSRPLTQPPIFLSLNQNMRPNYHIELPPHHSQQQQQQQHQQRTNSSPSPSQPQHTQSHLIKTDQHQQQQQQHQQQPQKHHPLPHQAQIQQLHQQMQQHHQQQQQQQQQQQHQQAHHINYVNLNDKRSPHILTQQQHGSGDHGHGPNQHHHHQQQHPQIHHHHQTLQPQHSQHQQQQSQHHAHSQHQKVSLQQQQQQQQQQSGKTVWSYDKNQKLLYHRIEYPSESIDMTNTPPPPNQPPSPSTIRWRKQPQQQQIPFVTYDYPPEKLKAMSDGYVDVNTMMVDSRRTPPTSNEQLHHAVVDGVKFVYKSNLNPGQVQHLQTNHTQISKTGSITQGYPTSRNSTIHSQQLQPPQMAGQPPQPPSHYRRMY